MTLDVMVNLIRLYMLNQHIQIQLNIALTRAYIQQRKKKKKIKCRDIKIQGKLIVLIERAFVFYYQ
jgi:hypothetical protein